MRRISQETLKEMSFSSAKRLLPYSAAALSALDSYISVQYRIMMSAINSMKIFKILPDNLSSVKIMTNYPASPEEGFVAEIPVPDPIKMAEEFDELIKFLNKNSSFKNFNLSWDQDNNDKWFVISSPR